MAPSALMFVSITRGGANWVAKLAAWGHIHLRLSRHQLGHRIANEGHRQMTTHSVLWLAADALTVWAWIWWLRRRPMFPNPRVRIVSSFVGLVFGSVSAVSLSLAVAANWWSGNVATITPRFNFIATVGVCFAVLGCGLSILGAGRARFFGVFVSLVTAAAWFGYGVTLRSGL